jgi:hypothetical protein
LFQLSDLSLGCDQKFLLMAFACYFSATISPLSDLNHQKDGLISPKTTSQAVKIPLGMQCMLSSVMTDSTEAWNAWLGSFDHFDTDGPRKGDSSRVTWPA